MPELYRASIFELLILIAAAFIAYGFALSQYKKQKLWEAKLQYYSDMISSLQTLVQMYDMYFPTKDKTQVDTETLNEAEKEHDIAYRKLWRAIESGSLIGHYKIMKILRDVMNDNNIRIVSLMQKDERFVEKAGALKATIDRVNRIAKTDLDNTLAVFWHT